MTKILFIMNTAELLGGGQVSLLALLRRLDRSVFEPYAIVGGEGEMQASLSELGLHCSIIPQPTLRTLDVKSIGSSILSIVRFIRSNHIDLVHSNDSRAHFYAGIAARLTGVPSVFHYRVSDSDGWYDRLLPLLATRVVAVSRATAARFRGLGDKVEVIYYCVDTTRFVPGRARAPGLPIPVCHTPLIGTIGRVGRQKGIDVFLRAVAVLKNSFPDIGAIIVGKDEFGQKAGMVALRAELGLDKHVSFIDSFPDVPGFMAALDVFTILSDNEGLNRSILEAMACGKPVVATRVGGNPEVVDDKVGRLVPYGDPGAAAGAIKEFLESPALREETGVYARRRVMQQFSLDTKSDRIATLFLELAGRRSDGRTAL